MINGILERFLDTGWWNADATIYYNGFIHFFESYVDNTHTMHLRIMKWRTKNIDNEYYEDIKDENGHWIDFSQIEMEGPNEDALREKFLKAKIWDGKSFWEVEKDLAWLDDGNEYERSYPLPVDKITKVS